MEPYPKPFLELDINRDGSTDTNPDALLITRYMFGLRGDKLLENLNFDGSTLSTAEEIEEKNILHKLYARTFR